MRSLIILVACVSVGAFFFQNNTIPMVQVKLYALLYSMRQKSPELDIPEGVFCSEIKGFNLYVKEKGKNGLLKDMIIYDYSAGSNNARVIVADSGRLKTSIDKMFLVLTLHNGESFENLNKEANNSQGKAAVPYRRESFETKEILIEFDANFTRIDDSFWQNEYMGKNLESLQASIDSMTLRLDSIRDMNARNVLNGSYRKTIMKTEPPASPGGVLNFDSLYQAESNNRKSGFLTRAKSSAQEMKEHHTVQFLTVSDDASRLRRHLTEWHKKFTVSAACLIFFFIGAPLGAIIRKGGLGVPVILSIFLFIFYFILDNIGLKMARNGIWEAWQGMWFSAIVLTPLGVFLTYKAVNDSVILNADTYLNALKNLFGKRPGRKVALKEVIIDRPDYEAMVLRLERLASGCRNYLATHKRWMSYPDYWKRGAKDTAAGQLAAEVEGIVEELGNSDRILVLNKLMDYPVITGYNQSAGLRMNEKTGLIIACILPAGLPVYLWGVYQRRLLLHDIKVVQRVCGELLEMMPR